MFAFVPSSSVLSFNQFKPIYDDCAFSLFCHSRYPLEWFLSKICFSVHNRGHLSEVSVDTLVIWNGGLWKRSLDQIVLYVYSERFFMSLSFFDIIVMARYLMICETCL